MGKVGSLTSILIFFAATAGAFPTAAADFQGAVYFPANQTSPPQVKLPSDDNSGDLSCYNIKAQSDNVVYELSLLESGDVIGFEGTLFKKEQAVEIHSVSFVGLRRILGTWIDEDKTVFQFEDFENLEISYEYGTTTNWTYALYPNYGDLWDIQMESGTNVVIGNIQVIEGLKSKILKLEVQNPVDGKKLFEKELRPLYLINQ
jgi:hypothetical protein